MNPGVVVKLRPTGPWRIGSDSGARNQVDSIYHSDSLYSAITAAMSHLGFLEEWLDATSRNVAGPAVSFSSLFPFQDQIGFVPPPRSIWPPPAGVQGKASKTRWKSARLIPLGVVGALIAGHVLDEEQWTVDGTSQCLVPVGAHGPFRVGVRWNAAVDRLTGCSERHASACLEFRPGAGLWAVISFAGDEEFHRWSAPLRGAFRLLADSGFGGERSRGWGRAAEPEFIDGVLPDMILPPQSSNPAIPAETPAAAPVDGSAAAPPSESGAMEEEPAARQLPATANWLLSLFAPAPDDAVDWALGNYAVLARGGRIDSPVRSGELKKELRMITEGSVIYAARPIRGCAPDVAPDGFPHPVFRSGFALAIPIQLSVAS